MLRRLDGGHATWDLRCSVSVFRYSCSLSSSILILQRVTHQKVRRVCSLTRRSGRRETNLGMRALASSASIGHRLMS